MHDDAQVSTAHRGASVPDGLRLTHDDKYNKVCMLLDPDKIYRVFHAASQNGKQMGMFISDLQEEEGRWYLVVEWQGNHDGEFPALRLEIDPRLLRSAPSPRHQFFLEHAVEYPGNWQLPRLEDPGEDC